eukprot:jgi/Bigna1/144515/aug1.88_g19223
MAAGRFFLILACGVASGVLFPLPDGGFGPTLVVKTRNVTAIGNGNNASRLLYVSEGCRVHILDASRQGNLTLLASSELLNTTDACEDGHYVSGIGTSKGGEEMVVGTQDGLLYLLKKREFGLIATPIAFQQRNITSFSRVSDAVDGFINGGSEIYMVAAVDSEGNGIVLFVQKGANSVLGYKAVGKDITDVQLVSREATKFSENHYSLLVIASASSQMVLLRCEILSTATEPELKMTILNSMDVPDDNDGIAVQNAKPQGSTLVYIASGSNGLVAVDLASGAVRGQTQVQGWAGGVRLLRDLAIVASDPGVFGYNITDPEKMHLAWSCDMNKGQSGLGWDLDVDTGSDMVFIADVKGGMASVVLKEPCEGCGMIPVIISHFGKSSVLSCTSSGIHQK